MVFNHAAVRADPTVLAGGRFEGLGEIRSGNYVFLDLPAVRLGVASLGDVAFSVLASVVSANETYAIIDAGSRVLSSDLGPHGTGGVRGYDRAFPIDADIDEATVDSSLLVEKLSEEHGFVRHGESRLRIGDCPRIVPNHSCPAANLADWFHVLNEDDSTARWRVAAAGKVV